MAKDYKYRVELTYNATIEVEVEAKNEGDALEKAREKAENSDINMYSLFGETNARFTYRNDY